MVRKEYCSSHSHPKRNFGALRSGVRRSTMVRGRVACWKADPADATTATLAASLEPDMEEIVKKGDEALYGSTSFAKRDANYAMLSKWDALLSRLRALDSRGSFFSQEDVQEAMKVCIDAKTLGSTIHVFAEKRGIAHDDYIALLSLKLRVMCAHERLRQPTVKDEFACKKLACIHSCTLEKKARRSCQMKKLWFWSRALLTHRG